MKCIHNSVGINPKISCWNNVEVASNFCAAATLCVHYLFANSPATKNFYAKSNPKTDFCLSLSEFPPY